MIFHLCERKKIRSEEMAAWNRFSSCMNGTEQNEWIVEESSESKYLKLLVWSAAEINFIKTV